MKIKYVLIIIVINILLIGCSSVQIHHRNNPNPWNYYYTKKDYQLNYIAQFYYQQPNKITKSQYRISPPYIQNMYEKIDGDECDEIHCPQI